jgi:hypothetical protein
VQLALLMLSNHRFYRVMEQPQAIGRALGFGGRLSFDTATLGGLDEQIDKLKNIDVSLVPQKLIHCMDKSISNPILCMCF